MTILEDTILSLSSFDTSNQSTIYYALIILVVAAVCGYFALIRQINGNDKNEMTKELINSSSFVNAESVKRQRVPGPICPFSAETAFVVETAEHLPPTPLDLHDSWLLDKSKPLAARWLNAGISNQDKSGTLRASLKRMRNSEHFLVEERNVGEEMLMKARALDNPNMSVFVAEPDSVAAQKEALELLLTFLPKKYPKLYVYDNNLQTIYVEPINKTFYLSEWKHRPLELCGRIVQEDLVLMRPPKPSDKSKQYAMAAAVVVFSFDELHQKLGQPVNFLHAPVPGFEKHLSKTVDMTFDRILKVENPMWRNNWGLSRSAEVDKPLYGAALEHVNRTSPITTTEHVRNSLFLKVEYQTIRRLPATNYLLFTVKTMVDPFRSLEEAPMAAQCLATSIRGMSSAMRMYKGIPNDNRTCEVILNYLDSIVNIQD